MMKCIFKNQVFRRTAAALLTAATALSALPVFGAAVASEQQVLFYNYTAATLLPKLGFANRSTSSVTITSDDVWGEDNPIRCWDNDRQGLVSANCVDLNTDGTPELLVTWLAKDPKSEVDKNETAMYATIYTVNDTWDGVVEQNTVRLFGDNGTGFHYVLGGLINIGSRRYLAVQELTNPYFMDGDDISYVFYSYTGKELREYFRVGKTDGETMAFAYKYVKTASDGSKTDTLLWADSNYLEDHPGSPLSDGDIGDALVAGFELAGISAPEVIQYDNADYSAYTAKDNAFPSYFGSSVQKDVFEYVVSGSGDYASREMTAVVRDFSNLQEHLERRKIKVTEYLDYPATRAAEDKAAAEAAAKKKAEEEAAAKKKAEEEEAKRKAQDEDQDVVDVIDADSNQIFPDSSSRLLTADDIKGRSWDDLRQGINEIYARNGYIFKNPSILKFFRQFGWYEEKYSNQNDVYDRMSKTERKNVNYLNQYVDISNTKDVTGKSPDDYTELIDDTDVVG